MHTILTANMDVDLVDMGGLIPHEIQNLQSRSVSPQCAKMVNTLD